jgi:hypothetical protein
MYCKRKYSEIILDEPSIHIKKEKYNERYRKVRLLNKNNIFDNIFNFIYKIF